MLKKLGLTLLIAGLSIGAALAQDATPVPLPEAQSSITGGDEETLRAFILRYVVGPGQGQNVDITIGELPTGLPFTVSPPPNATVFGAVARPGQGSSVSFYDIFIDTTETPQSLLDFYKQTYTGDDWQIANESVYPPSAFSGQTSAYATFCYQQGAAVMSVNGFNEGRGVTNVSLNIQVPGDAYACANTEGITDPMLGLIPPLALPEGVVVQSNIGGGLSYYTPRGRSTNVSAVLESERPLADVANDYNAQLAAEGWQAVFSENSEHTAMSTWTLTDATGKPWQGTLLIVADRDANVYNAVIYVEE